MWIVGLGIVSEPRVIIALDYKIIVIGNLGRDPEMRYTPNGQVRQPTGISRKK